MPIPYSVLRNLIHGVYMIEPNSVLEYQFMLNSLRNGIQLEQQEEFDNTKPFNIDVVDSAGIQSADLISVHAVRDIMLRDDMGCGHIGTRTIGSRLLQSDADPNVMAHIIIFDTPGGAVDSVVELSEAIEQCQKPVYAWIDGYCASAGIYAASYCTEVHAHRATNIVGSVGTMAQFSGRKSGEKDSDGWMEFRVYASKSKKKNEKFEKALNDGNIKLVESWLDKYNERFIDAIKTNRPNANEEIHLTGDTWEASEVLGVFVDSIKTFDQLVQHIVDQQKQQKPNVTSNSHLNKSVITMNPKLSALVALLAVSGIEIVDGGAHLTEEMLETISAELEKLPQLESQLKDANTAKATAVTDLQTATATVAERDATIASLTEENAVLKSKPGTDGAQAITSSDDKSKNSAKTVAKGQSLADDLNAVASEYLNS